MSGSVEEGADPWQTAVRPRYTYVLDKCSPNADEFVLHAFQKNLITSREKEELQLPKTKTQRMDELVTILMRGGASTLTKFLDILNDIGKDKPDFTDLATELGKKACGY
ncbi:uncharacterized protein LOC135818053 [Sycon ciliatum]|uniref:uncharacterized protein LOC135818053 n=1 Tax=Sycon ciliatum TaxID=27933 RepID=UPI0031F69E9D